MIHKVGNIGIFVLLNFGNKLDIVISRINFNSMHQDKCKLPEQIILLITIYNLFTLKSIQKCQRCHLCALRKNSNGFDGRTETIFLRQDVTFHTETSRYLKRETE